MKCQREDNNNIVICYWCQTECNRRDFHICSVSQLRDKRRTRPSSCGLRRRFYASRHCWFPVRSSHDTLGLPTLTDGGPVAVARMSIRMERERERERVNVLKTLLIRREDADDCHTVDCYNAAVVLVVGCGPLQRPVHALVPAAAMQPAWCRYCSRGQSGCFWYRTNGDRTLVSN